MPYKSEAQRRWAHTPEGMRELGAKKVAEYDKKSRGKNLPEKMDMVNAITKSHKKRLSK